MQPKLNLAYFSPLPPQHTGVADYSAGLLPYLQKHAEITLFVENPSLVDPLLHHQFAIQSLDDYPAQRFQFDVPLYHMGNNQHHEAIYDLMRRYPGVVVLHDYFIHPYLADRAAREKNFGFYARELAYAQGMDGLSLSWNIRRGKIPWQDSTFPLNDRLLDLNLGIIVHNETASNDIHLNRPEAKVATIPHYVHRHTATSRRAELDWPEEAVIVGHCGYLTANRQVTLFMQTFARLKEEISQARLLIVGEVVNQEVDVAGLISAHGLEDVVHVTGYAPDQKTFLDWMVTTDFLVNLRHPTMGETSGTTLLALAIARPVLLFDHGWYAELPADTCYRVPIMDADALLAAMVTLATRPEVREQIGKQAQNYVREICNPDKVAEQYIAFINRVLLRPTISTRHSPQ